MQKNVVKNLWRLKESGESEQTVLEQTGSDAVLNQIKLNYEEISRSFEINGRVVMQMLVIGSTSKWREIQLSIRK